MYFKESGKINTERTLELAVKVAEERNIRNIVVASGSGSTAKFLKDIRDKNVICVTLATGSKEPGKNKMSKAVHKELTDSGMKVLTTTHVLSGAERGFSKKFGGISPIEIMAYTLKMFGQGTKVCVEISVMALDAGLIPYGEPIIAIGGSSQGADTAVIITPNHANNILDTKINEIICKPI
ncbi:pyruvate kinase alpha/beta domain-containing protein [Clostridium ganghwense]|uniref:Pyruvate kinase C-terminal domain-containing protein n=1 Tax=Clostridium ganghwense TaxID=312089 RepID=A0ABT4CXF5_9CLOT|nr:pyruvate kinase alpha/beta domain-containing protein [Clostridium ganghwense]MCY6372569.1 hypothetical protein [Clostridium ganghwense]